MTDLHRLPARTDGGALRVVVESPRGSHVKLKYEPALGVFTLSRPLVLGLSYPFDWGFVPGTRAPDGDPLDALVLLDQATFPGVVIACRAVGLLRLSQRAEGGGQRQRNDRLVAVPEAAARYGGLRDARKLPPRSRQEIEQFFLSAVLFEDKGARLLGWGGPRAAAKLVERAVRACEAAG